jgi:signal peptidase I
MRTRAALCVALALSLFAAIWWFVLPAALGGRATYVVTHGVSMQPRFQTGDLAVVYPASRYRTGEIAAYRSNLLHTVVLHRIVAKTADGYVLKGDNNSWRDPEHPTEDQMVGRLSARVPNGGVILDWVHNPLIAGLLTLAITTTGATGRRRRRHRRARAERTPMSLHDLRTISRTRWTDAAAAGMVALLCGGLAAATYVFSGPSVDVEKVPWSTQVSYAYTATTPANLVYPDGEVHPGQTVFRKLVTRLTVHATWSLHTDARHHIQGTARLQATVHGPAGWTHSVDLDAGHHIVGDRASLTGTIDLAALDTLVRHAADLTGVPTDSYTVAVQPLVDLTGTLADLPFGYAPARPDPALTLAITPSTVLPALAGAADGDNANSTPQPSSPAGVAGSPGLSPQATAHFTTVSRPGPASWDLVGHRVPVTSLRWAGASGAALGLLALVVLFCAGPDRNDPCVREARRHRASIISVSGLRLGPAGNVLEVASLKSLAQVARRYDRLILQQAATPGTYLVEDETALYRYRCTHRETRPGLRRRLAEQPRAHRPLSESA